MSYAIAIAALTGGHAGAGVPVSWDPSSAPGIQGGSGVWNTSLSNWDNTGVLGVWFNSHNDNAVFSGTAGGNVQVNSAITANLIDFEVAGYSLLGTQIITLNSGSVVANVDASIANPISTTGSFFKSGPGVLTLTGNSTAMHGVTVLDGTLAFSTDSNLGINTNSIVLAGGALRYTGLSAYILPSGRTFKVDTGGGRLDVSSGSFAMNTAGKLTGAGTLSKIGAQTLTIGAANTGFAGAFDVAAGTLVLALPSAGNGRPITLSGGSLLFRNDQASDFQSSVTVTHDSTLDVDRATVNGISGSSHSLGDLTINSAAKLKVGGNLHGNYPTVHNLDVSGSLSINSSAVLVQGTYSGSGPLTFGPIFQFPELFTGGLLFANARAQTVANPVTTDDLLGGDAVIGASGAATSVIYNGTWSGGGASATSSVVLRDGARFVLGPAARVNTLTPALAASRPFAAIGNGPANSFELDAAFVADHTAGGTINDGFTSLEVRDATLVTRASPSLPAVIKNDGVGGAHWMGSIVLSGTAGARWNVASADQQYAGGVTVSSTATIVADRNLTHNGFAAGKFDAQFQIPTAGVTLTKQGAGTLALAGNQGYAPGSKISVEAGVVRFDADPGAGWYTGHYTRGADGNIVAFPTPAGTLSVSVASAAAASAEFAAPLSRIDTLDLAAGGGGARINANSSSGDKALVLHTLTASNAALDITNNRLIADYDGATSPLAAIAAMIKSGFNAGGVHWKGPGITSATAASDPALGIGYAEAADVLHLSGVQTAEFGPATVDGTSVLVRLTRLGDADLNGVVDFADFQRLERGCGQAGQTWSGGDFNYDGNVDTTDFKLLYDNYGKGIDAQAQQISAVPEPGVIAMPVFVGAMLLRRRRPARRRL